MRKSRGKGKLQPQTDAVAVKSGYRRERRASRIFVIVPLQQRYKPLEKIHVGLAVGVQKLRRPIYIQSRGKRLTLPLLRLQLLPLRPSRRFRQEPPRRRSSIRRLIVVALGARAVERNRYYAVIVYQT
jgi:hypothetical protein